MTYPDRKASEFMTGAHELAHVAGHGEKGARKTRDILKGYNPATKRVAEEYEQGEKDAGYNPNSLLNSLLDRFGR
jgi:hypothetical protein